MRRKTKDPTSGRLITLGREALGQFIGKIDAFERVLGESRCHFASFSDSKCDGLEGGARFTASACKMVAGLIINNIATGGRNLPVQWPDLSSDYEKEKEKYAPDKGQWRLTDHIINHIDVQKRRGEAGRSVGIYGRGRVPKIGFDVMHGWPATKKLYPSQYAFWNEFGTAKTKYSGGQPPRPVFIPTYQQFARDYLPKLADAICASLEEDYERLKKNINKPSGKGSGGVEDVGYVRGMHVGEMSLDNDEFGKVSNNIAKGINSGSDANFKRRSDEADEARAKREAAKCLAKAKSKPKRRFDVY